MGGLLPVGQPYCRYAGKRGVAPTTHPITCYPLQVFRVCGIVRGCSTDEAKPHPANGNPRNLSLVAALALPITILTAATFPMSYF